jgi:hypothetical protein
MARRWDLELLASGPAKGPLSVVSLSRAELHALEKATRRLREKRPQGREEPLAALTPVFGDSLAQAMRGLRALGAQPDDVVIGNGH